MCSGGKLTVTGACLERWAERHDATRKIISLHPIAEGRKACVSIDPGEGHNDEASRSWSTRRGVESDTLTFDLTLQS